MASALAAIRDRVELELRDSGNAIWTTGEIDAYLRRALARINNVLPAASVGTITTSAGVFEYATSGLTGLLYVDDVWFPWDSTDPGTANRIEWSVPQDGYIRLDVDAVSGDYPARVFYRVARTIKDLDSATVTTLTWPQEEAAVMGAAAYAAIAAGVESINAVTVSGWTPRQWLEWGRVREEQFAALLEEMRLEAMAAIDGRITWELDWGA